MTWSKMNGNSSVVGVAFSCLRSKRQIRCILRRGRCKAHSPPLPEIQPPPDESEEAFEMGRMDLDGNFETANSRQHTMAQTPGLEHRLIEGALFLGQGGRACQPQNDVLGRRLLLLQMQQLGYQQGRSACGPMLQNAHAIWHGSSEEHIASEAASASCEASGR